jgi:arginyl-tRNA synthetase
MGNVNFVLQTAADEAQVKKLPVPGLRKSTDHYPARRRGGSAAEAVKVSQPLFHDIRIAEVDEVLASGADFGRGAPKGERVMVEYAQPNTHHSFHIGHTRTTLLGESLARILEFAGFDTIRASYPGDEGLSVATVLWVYEKFHKGQEPEGIHERGQWMQKIYAEATAMLEPKPDETAEEKALREAYDAERREMYRKLDAGDPYVHELWYRTREWSLEELKSWIC